MKNHKKIICFDARNTVSKKDVIQLVYNTRINYLLVTYDESQKIKAPSKTILIVEVGNKEQLKNINKEYIIYSSNIEVLNLARKNGNKTAYNIVVKGQKEMDDSWKIGQDCDFLFVDLISETNIPLELIIAKLQQSKTVLLKSVTNWTDAEIAFGVMEAGSDGISLKTKDFEQIMLADKYLQKAEISKIELQTAIVQNVSHVGMGYRYCIDTTDLLTQNEGMIVGSTSNGGLVVSSETHFLPYMELRPFRVNAGAAHSYIWMPEDMTGYLTELKAGSKVTCVDTEGNCREVTVGRVKGELRPLLLIEAIVNETPINAIVQDDWHIRLFCSKGKPINASSIKKGDELLSYTCLSGRHVGIKIDEKIIEN